MFMSEEASPRTYFAPPERASAQVFQRELQIVTSNAVLDTMLQTASGVLAVLNDKRQILAVNDTFLRSVGITDGPGVLGLRPGQAIGCVHAEEDPAGCGTTRYCSTCGAALAIIACLDSGQSSEQRCYATVEREGIKHDLMFNVRSTGVTLEGVSLVLLFMQDVTVQQRWAVIERAFLHDLSTLATALLGTAERLPKQNPDGMREFSARILKLSERLANEIIIQRALSRGNLLDYTPAWEDIVVPDIADELRIWFSDHTVRRAKSFVIDQPVPDVTIRSASSCLIRVLANMVTNALEATPEGGLVRLHIESTGRRIAFSVWNAQQIPPDIALRIFQRNFSTKGGDGRGVGTFSMKLLGEEVLGGEISFTSDEENGTTFTLVLPQKQ